MSVLRQQILKEIERKETEIQAWLGSLEAIPSFAEACHQSEHTPYFVFAKGHFENMIARLKRGAEALPE